MKALIGVALAAAVLMPTAAFAGASTDAALGLGAFAVFNQLLGGVGIFRGVAAPPPAVVVTPLPPPVVYPVPTYAAPVYAYPAPVYVVPAPPYYAPGPVLLYRSRHHWRYEDDD